MRSSWSRRQFIHTGLLTAGIVSFSPGLGMPTKDAQPDGGTEPSGGKGRDISDWQAKIALALQHEHGAIIQYTNHCGKLKTRGLMDQAMTIQAIIHDEIRHAQDMIHILADSGLEPTLAVWPPKTSQKAEVMLRQDIAAEQGAIDLYTEILKTDLPAVARERVRRALAQEIEHKDLFDNLIEKIQQP